MRSLTTTTIRAIPTGILSLPAARSKGAMAVDCYVRPNRRTTQVSSLLDDIRIQQPLLRCRTYRTLAAQPDHSCVPGPTRPQHQPKIMNRNFNLFALLVSFSSVIQAA